MKNIDEVSRSKWIALSAFLIINFMQILLVAVLTLDETSIFIIGYDPSLSNPLGSLVLFLVISIVQLVVVYISAFQMLKGKDMIELYPSHNEKHKWKCKYSRNDIVEWTQHLAESSQVSISKIYIIKSPIPNAFTFSLPGIGSIVIVHTNLLELLNQDEVQAIIAHELGHIKRRDSLISIFSRMPSYFVDVIYLYIYVRLGLGIANSLLVQFDIISGIVRGLVLLAFFVLSRVLMWLATVIVQKASRDAELLADHHSATIVNTEVMINALIRLGLRIEAITALIEELRWLESLNPAGMNPINEVELKMMLSSFPLDNIDEEKAREKAPAVFLSTRLSNMRVAYGLALTDELIYDIISSAIANLRDKRKKILSDRLETESKIIDWREADEDGDTRIATSEMKAFIQLLRTNPTKFMFTNESSADMLTMGHPDFRRRIIFLADAFEF